MVSSSFCCLCSRWSFVTKWGRFQRSGGSSSACARHRMGHIPTGATSVCAGQAMRAEPADIINAHGPRDSRRLDHHEGK